MSLVGNLEDLSLGDLLQIVSLSQKSGVLSLESVGGAGQILFRSGLVHAAGIKGRTADLRGLLLAAGLVEGARFDAALAAVGARSPDRPARLAAELGLEPEAIDALIRTSAEAAIFEMFAWATGEFSFDAHRDADGPETFASLQRGLNAQYLAMEGMRLRDEDARSAAGAAPAEEIELSDELFFGSDPLETDVETELELESELAVPAPPLVAVTAPDAVVAPKVDAAVVPAAVDLVVARTAARVDDESSIAPIASATPDASPPPADPTETGRPVVVIEPDALALEWLKAEVDGSFARVHVFQRAEQGLARIRQYLIRGDVPIVLIAITAPIDPLSGIHGLADFVRRLRTQAPRIVVVGLREDGESKTETVPAYLDAVLTRPGRQQLRSAGAGDSASKSAALAQAVLEVVSRKSRSKPGPAVEKADKARSAGTAAPPADGAARAGLAAARSQNEVFGVVLDAAAGLFARAAVLLLRDQEVFAVAGRGIEVLEVDPLSTPPRLSCRVPETGLLHQVVSSRRPVAGSLRSDADRMFVGVFGPIEPKRAYLAPIRIPGGGLAILYADQGGARREAPDSAPLEALIVEAEAVLERIAAHRVEGEARPVSS
jgi:hypothetical protein